ncbi:MAG: hypothetical protein PHU25_18010 [Deltaproteobacteria bacterium]|nr:hypothetical protein [Deltaproteobacteria bacterium]
MRPRSRMTGLAALGAALAFAGCQAVQHTDTTPAGAGPNQMLNDTAVGQNRCDAGKITSSPFVVEWDATDLSTFEAKASRDLVFVRYEGCKIDLLYGCSDNGIPGRYGRYQDPTFTSGTVESFTMKNEDELFAKLPLGAARFGGSVKTGEALELRYYVSGAVNSTRNYVERKAIADNPRCAGATHFVSAYNLGAFELLAHKGLSGEAGVDIQGAGGGAKTTSDSSNLKQGGSLESCETQAQRQCRVPIRLVLQPVDESAQNLDKGSPAAAPIAAPIDPPPPAEDTPWAKAYKLRQSAAQKEQAGDGRGCLDDLERARKLEDTEQSRRTSLYTGALCSMRAGKCDEGRKMFREYLKNEDKQHKMTDNQITVSVDTLAKSKCPVAQQKDMSGKAQALMVQLQEAQGRSDPQGCIAAGKEAEKIVRTARSASVQEKNTMNAVAMMTAQCLAQLERCKDAREWWDRYYDLQFTGTMPAAEVKSAAAQTFATFPQCKGK